MLRDASEGQVSRRVTSSHKLTQRPATYFRDSYLVRWPDLPLMIFCRISRSVNRIIERRAVIPCFAAPSPAFSRFTASKAPPPVDCSLPLFTPPKVEPPHRSAIITLAGAPPQGEGDDQRRRLCIRFALNLGYAIMEDKLKLLTGLTPLLTHWQHGQISHICCCPSVCCFASHTCLVRFLATWIVWM